MGFNRDSKIVVFWKKKTNIAEGILNIEAADKLTNSLKFLPKFVSPSWIFYPRDTSENSQWSGSVHYPLLWTWAIYEIKYDGSNRGVCTSALCFGAAHGFSEG